MHFLGSGKEEAALLAQDAPGKPNRAQKAPSKPNRAQEAGEPNRAQRGSGEPNRAQEWYLEQKIKKTLKHLPKSQVLGVVILVFLGILGILGFSLKFALPVRGVLGFWSHKSKKC